MTLKPTLQAASSSLLFNANISKERRPMVIQDTSRWDLEAGDLKVEKGFAFLPVRINGKKIWLRRYQRLWEWNERYRKVFIDGDFVGRRWLFAWDIISEKL